MLDGYPWRGYRVCFLDIVDCLHCILSTRIGGPLPKLLRRKPPQQRRLLLLRSKHHNEDDDSPCQSLPLVIRLCQAQVPPPFRRHLNVHNPDTFVDMGRYHCRHGAIERLLEAGIDVAPLLLPKSTYQSQFNESSHWEVSKRIPCSTWTSDQIVKRIQCDAVPYCV
jgi:hypothetical protein